MIKARQQNGLLRKTGKVLRLIHNNLKILFLFLWRYLTVQKKIGKAIDGRDRRLEFMRKVIDEVAA